MDEHIIVKLVREAKRRHGGMKKKVYPAIHNDWHQSYAFADGWHVLEYKIKKREKTSHCVAMDVFGNFLVEE